MFRSSIVAAVAVLTVLSTGSSASAGPGIIFHHAQKKGGYGAFVPTAPLMPAAPISPLDIFSFAQMGLNVLGSLHDANVSRRAAVEPPPTPKLTIDPEVNKALDRIDTTLGGTVDKTNALLKMVRANDPRLKDLPDVSVVKPSSGSGSSTSPGNQPGRVGVPGVDK